MRKKPFIAVRPINHAREHPKTGSWQFTNAIDSWSWRGFEGEKAVVEVYSQGSYVELYLNRKRIGRKKLKDYKAIFNTKYRNGMIEAVSYNNDGKEVARHSLSTGGRQTQITIKSDKYRISKDDLVFTEIEITDENGKLIPYIEKRVSVCVNGNAAQLIGMGSALCKTDERFTQSFYNSYRGRCIAVFKGIAKGTSLVTVSCGNCALVTQRIEVVK